MEFTVMQFSSSVQDKIPAWEDRVLVSNGWGFGPWRKTGRGWQKVRSERDGLCGNPAPNSF